MKHVVDALKASKRKATHQRDNWKARAMALQAENTRLRGTLFDVYVRIEKMQDICTANAPREGRAVARTLHADVGHSES